MEHVRIGALTLLPRRQLQDETGRIPLGGRALDILSVLAAARGETVSKDQLMEAVWPGVIVEENAIQVHVAALRKALGGEAYRLTTVRGVGYRLDLPAEPMPFPVPAGSMPLPGLARGDGADAALAPDRARIALFAAMVAAALIVGLLLGWSSAGGTLTPSAHAGAGWPGLAMTAPDGKTRRFFA